MIKSFMISRASTPERCALFENTVVQAIETSGTQHWRLTLHTLTQEAKKVAESLAYKYAAMLNTKHYDTNVGQHTITNIELDALYPSNIIYDKLLRLDDDVEFISKNWLATLNDESDALGDRFIVSPTIKGLSFPPEVSGIVEVQGIPIKLLPSAIGGICRLHHVSTLYNKGNSYYSDVRKAMGAGDATGLGEWCQRNRVWMCYLEHVRVRHAHTTAKQVELDPLYHSLHDLFQTIPYIPTWNDDKNDYR